MKGCQEKRQDRISDGQRGLTFIIQASCCVPLLEPVSLEISSQSIGRVWPPRPSSACGTPSMESSTCNRRSSISTVHTASSRRLIRRGSYKNIAGCCVQHTKGELVNICKYRGATEAAPKCRHTAWSVQKGWSSASSM